MAVAQGLTVRAPESSLTESSGPATKVGALFAAFTVIVKVCGAEVASSPGVPGVPPSSDRVRVMLAVPD